eukprot:80963-Pyramimonas_sp.AAC.1
MPPTGCSESPEGAPTRPQRTPDEFQTRVGGGGVGIVKTPSPTKLTTTTTTKTSLTTTPHYSSS